MPHAPRILIVEDHFLVAMDCELALSASGFECVGVANTAWTAVELAEREQPDLVLMDIQLTGRSDGIDAAIEIYERFGIRSLLTSGHANEILRKHAEQAHPAGWLDKPYSSGALIEAVQTALTTSGRRAPPDLHAAFQPIPAQ